MSIVGDKVYLGDGVYAEWEHDDLVLTTENGIETTNRIVLELEVIIALARFMAARKKPIGLL